MKTISKPGDNLGGLTKIWAIPSDVYSINGKAVTVSDDSNVYLLYCTPETMGFDEAQKKSDAGTYYVPTVSGFVPGNDEVRREAFNYMERRKWVIVFIDGNGNYLAAGSNLQPLKLTGQFSSGKDTVGRSGFSFSFAGECTERAKFINNPF